MHAPFYFLISFSTSIMLKQAIVPHALYIAEGLQSPRDVQLWPISNLTTSQLITTLTSVDQS